MLLNNERNQLKEFCNAIQKMLERGKPQPETSGNVTRNKCSDHVKELPSDTAGQSDEITAYLFVFHTDLV